MSAVPLRRGRRAVMMSAASAGLAAVLAGLTGCSSSDPVDPDKGTNGVGKLTPAEIQSRTRAAAGAATSVRLSGTILVKDESYRLDMRLSERGGTGSVRSKDSTFRLLKVEDQLYLKADSSFWTHEGDGAGPADRAAAEKLDGKYVKVPDDDPTYQRLSGFAAMDVLLDGLVTLHGTLEKGERGSTGGTKSIRLTGDKGAGGTLDVSLEGRPFPLRLVRGGKAGTLSLTDWNAEFPLRKPEPSEVVDYGRGLPVT
ncbi:hypothetical protein ACWD6I_13040 [Streptomyces sp. NPDC002454]|uniref:hypothetical protein n=1 Tax=unclassified Streptomyces TaxID=2593676 RepID=UPI0033253084